MLGSLRAIYKKGRYLATLGTCIAFMALLSTSWVSLQFAQSFCQLFDCPDRLLILLLKNVRGVTWLLHDEIEKTAVLLSFSVKKAILLICIF